MLQVVFFDGINWDYDVSTPLERPLGGSQSALCYLAVALARRGHRVRLFNGAATPRDKLGVACRPARQMTAADLRGNCDVFICLNGPGRQALEVRPNLPPGVPLVLWTQHSHDQAAMQDLADPAVRDAWDLVVCVSNWHRDSMIRRYDLDPARTAVLRNAVTPAFEELSDRPEELARLKGSRPVLAYTSTPFRGLDVLLDVYHDMHREFPTTELRVYSSLLVYQQTEAADAYRPLYERCRSAPGVVYIGSLPQPRLAAALREAAILAFPSTFAETSCIGVIEALAAGLAVVTSDLGALPETTLGFGTLVRPQVEASDRAAFLARYRSALRDTLTSLATDPTSFWSRRAEQVRAIRTGHTWEARAPQWEDAIAGWRRAAAGARLFPAAVNDQAVRADLLVTSQDSRTTESPMPTHAPQNRTPATDSAATPVEELAGRALDAYRSGQCALAEQLCSELLRLDPLHPTTAYLLGAQALNAGNHALAAQHFHHAALLEPANANNHHALAEACRAAGHPRLAVAAYRESLRLEPRRAATSTGLGLALRDLGDLAAAIEAFRDSLAVDPRMARTHLNLGQALLDRNEVDAAAAAFTEAIRLQPDYALGYNNLGVTLQAQGKHQSAVEPLRKALQLRPDYPEAHFNLGVSLLAMGDSAGALPSLQEAIRIRPRYLRAQIKLAEALSAQGRGPEALAAGRAAVQLDPESAEASEALGYLYTRYEDWVSARSAFDRLRQLRPQDATAFAFAFRMRELLCDWQTRAADLRRLEDETLAALALGRPPAVTPFHALSLSWSAERQRDIAVTHADAMDRCLEDTRRTLGFSFSRTRPRKLRIGYLSADFHNHATLQLMIALFGLHDRESFEIIGYSYGPDDGSELRRRLMRDCDRFVDLAALPHTEAARRIHADGIHILMELKGPTGLSRPEIAALRPAPIQAHYLGFPGTSGAAWNDYFISDQVTTPQELAAAFREKLVILPHTYQVNDYCQPISEKVFRRADFGLPETGFVFCCFNNSYKFEPLGFGIWMRVLAKVPGSVLWLLSRQPEVSTNLHKAAQAHGITPGRIVIAGEMPKPLHLARHRLAGLFLDTLFYNAHTTASDALWAGLPVLTCPGRTFASRVAASLVTAAGLPELIVPNLEEYERRAIHLATHPEELARLRDKLAKQRATCPLFDTPRFTRNLEQAFRTMWENYEKGAAPRQIVVADRGPAVLVRT